MSMHFEIMGYKAGRWSILKIEQDQEIAVRAAAGHWDTGSFKAVKVMREKLNPVDGTYASNQVYLKGSEPKKSKERKTSSVACWKPGDLSSYEGRRTITRLLRPELDRWQITSLELTHVPEHYYRLDKTGVVLQNVVQKAAIEQVQDTDTSIQDRMKELYSLIGVAVSQLNKTCKEKNKIPNLKKLGIERVISKLGEQEDRSYILTLSIAHAFQPMATIVEKYAYIVEIIKQEHPLWIHTTVDRIIGELLASPFVFKNMLADFDGLGNTLIALAKLSKGTLKDPKASKETKALNSLIQLNRFRQVGLAIFGRMGNELKGNQPIGKGAIDELKTLGMVIKALKTGADNQIKDVRLLEGINDRSTRCLSQQNISQYLMNITSPVEQVMALTELAPLIHSEAAQRKLAGYFIPILTANGNEEAFSSLEGDYLERMKNLTKIQHGIINSGLPDDRIEALSERLDDNCLYILENTRMLPKLRGGSSGPVVAGKKLLKMIASGHFTAGRSIKKARAEARAYMRLPSFLAKCIVGNTAEEKAKNVKEFQNLLTMAGMTVDKNKEQA